MEQITNTEYEKLFSNEGMVEEESEAEIDPANVKCVNYFVYDFPKSLMHKKKVNTRYEMQAVCTEKYLVYTTPEKVNFISLKQVKKAKEIDISITRAKKENRILCCQNRLREAKKTIKEVGSKIRENFVDPIRNLWPNNRDEESDLVEAEKSEDEDVYPGEIEVKSIDLTKYYVPEILSADVFIYELRTLDRKFVVRDYKKERKDSIQIRIGQHISIIWDLKENEEITNLIGWRHLNKPECIVRSGHRLTDSEGHELNSCKDKQLYAGKDWCARLYAEIDIDLMQNIQSEC